MTSLIHFRVACELILACDQLNYNNKSFWIEAFRTIKKILPGVDYKGVREIMKGCRDKIQSFPQNINLSLAPQMEIVENVIEYIFDRNACLLPGYFIANEIQKSGLSHWKITKLTSNFVEDFRNIAQMISIIGHPHMLPIVQHFGYTETLINPWRLDSTTLKFTFRGILPYDPELTQPQTKLLRYILEQPYSKDMVCSMLNLQKPVILLDPKGFLCCAINEMISLQNKQHCLAIEEQLVWLIMSAMERSEQEHTKPSGDGDDALSNIHWLWAHISSQLIYFVLFQFASFSNIVTTLHDKVNHNIREQCQTVLSDWLVFNIFSWPKKSLERVEITLCGRCCSSSLEAFIAIR